MAKILALDVGQKRVGLAISDDLNIIAMPYKTIERAGAVLEVKNVIEIEGIELVVVGLPLLASGDPGSQAKDIELFTQELRANIDQKIEYENEFLTSVEATEKLKSSKKRNIAKEEIDQMAAAIILEAYIKRINARS